MLGSVSELVLMSVCVSWCSVVLCVGNVLGSVVWLVLVGW